MTGSRQQLPQFLTEDYISVLRALVLLAWLAVLAMSATEVWVRLYSPYPWPQSGGFSATYNGVLIEFTLNTLVLTALLVYRDWYERVPRETLHRLRWLLVAVLAWEGLHLFGAFHASGAVSGPLLLLLPVVCIAALTAFPGSGGWLLVTYLLGGHAIVILLERLPLIPPGQLGAAFAYAPPAASPLGIVALLVVLASALVLAMILRRRTFLTDTVLHPARRIDYETGLYRRAFLDERVRAELGRIQRQGGAMTLLVVAFDGDETQGSATDSLRSLADLLIPRLRHDSDTPARFGPAAVAVLLPAADSSGAESLVQRIARQVSTSGARLRLCAVSVSAAAARSHVQPGRIMAMADEGLRSATSGGDVVMLALDA
jgi:diguanylate cyclase (GGDEF)-like protein